MLNMAAVNMGCKYFYSGVWNSLVMFLGATLLSHTIVLSSIFSIISKLVPTMAVLIYTLPHTPTVNDGSFLSTSSLTHIVRLVDDSHALPGVRQYFKVDLVCFSKHFMDPEYSLQHLLAICISLFIRFYSDHLPIGWIAVLFPWYLICVNLSKC